MDAPTKIAGNWFPVDQRTVCTTIASLSNIIGSSSPPSILRPSPPLHHHHHHHQHHDHCYHHQQHHHHHHHSSGHHHHMRIHSNHNEHTITIAAIIITMSIRGGIGFCVATNDRQQCF